MLTQPVHSAGNTLFQLSSDVIHVVRLAGRSVALALPIHLAQ